jgi:hypothetical protein
MSTLNVAVRVAKRLHREHGNKRWFKATKICRPNHEVIVRVVFESQYRDDVQSLTEHTIKEDGVLIAFGEG